MQLSFRDKLVKRKLLIGTLLTLPSPEIAEVLAEAGFDWLFVDMEHTSLTVQDVQRIIQAVEYKCPCLVRVHNSDEVWMKKVLDTGPSGVIIPHVNSAEEAQIAVQHCHYPPKGTRSVGISRAQGYGQRTIDSIKDVDQNTVLIPQIEHINAVRHIESIVEVPGIAAIFVGPYDLSGSMGKLGMVSDSEVQSQIERVRTICLDAGLVLGIFGVDAEAVKPYIGLGFTLIAVGVDTLLLGRAAQRILESLRS